MKRYLAIAIGLIVALNALAQDYYHFLVEFKDKNMNYHRFEDAVNYLTPASVERRKRLSVAFDDHDLPVSDAYVQNILSPALQLRYTTKWLNGAVVSTQHVDSAWRLKIKFFVKDVVYLGKTNGYTSKSGKQSVSVTNPDNELSVYGAAASQIEMIKANYLHDNGFTGKGIRIAVLDAGFRRANELEPLRHLFTQNRVPYTLDLVDMEEDVYDDDSHGLHVLGCMAANQRDKIVGTAPDADYYLFRTEASAYESWLEELNWVRAAEIADSLGVDLINSSLGYNTFDEKRHDHSHDDLDGNTTYVSKGASIAASRGILVVNSAGNDGNKSWGKLDFPADAKNILVVGAVDDEGDVPGFSSPGPTADYRIKPDVAALGHNTKLVATYGVGTGNGTSYSCPLVAGMMACVIQANPLLGPEQLINIARLSGHQATQPDNAIGFGIPNGEQLVLFCGKNATFNYKSPQTLDVTSIAEVEQTYLTFNPTNQSVTCEVLQQKRFLFFKYWKSKGIYENRVVGGFSKVHVPLYNTDAKKMIKLKFVFDISQNGIKNEYVKTYLAKRLN